MDWLLRVDVAVLALLLAYTFAAIIRASHHYHRARGEAEINSAVRRQVAAGLNIQVRNLESIAIVAPYLGLVGTCLGILGAFSGVGMGIHAYTAWIMSKLAAALVPAAAGIIVALAATCGYEYARTPLDLLVNELPGCKRLPTRRFIKSPPFALIAAPVLAILVGIITLGSFHMLNGFDVRVASARCEAGLSDRLVVLRISNTGRIFVNLEEEQDWSSLQLRLSEIYRMRAHRVLYLLADAEVPFQTVADAMDTVHSLDLTVLLITPTAMNAPCPQPVVVNSALHPSR